MYKFFAFLNRMKYIKRWSLMRSNSSENIMEHSQQVTILAHALALIKNKFFNGNIDEAKVLLLAQYHESGEVITGDLPTPIKYFNSEIKNAYKDLEKEACIKLLNMLPNELKTEYEKYVLPDTSIYEYKLVKCADKLSAYIKCLEELKSGNLEFKKAKETIETELFNLCNEFEELDYFMKNFINAYNLTLDELD